MSTANGYARLQTFPYKYYGKPWMQMSNSLSAFDICIRVLLICHSLILWFDSYAVKIMNICKTNENDTYDSFFFKQMYKWKRHMAFVRQMKTIYAITFSSIVCSFILVFVICFALCFFVFCLFVFVENNEHINFL